MFVLRQAHELPVTAGGWVSLSFSLAVRIVLRFHDSKSGIIGLFVERDENNRAS